MIHLSVINDKDSSSTFLLFQNSIQKPINEPQALAAAGLLRRLIERRRVIGVEEQIGLGKQIARARLVDPEVLALLAQALLQPQLPVHQLLLLVVPPLLVLQFRGRPGAAQLDDAAVLDRGVALGRRRDDDGRHGELGLRVEDPGGAVGRVVVVLLGRLIDPAGRRHLDALAALADYVEDARVARRG